VDVAVEAQNQEVLSSMNRRAAMQLRLQQTVEGFSVVAITYYAVNLLTYLLTPVAEGFGIDKVYVAAVSAPVVLIAVFTFVRRMRKRLSGDPGP
jgi:uncharacterized membrane-anchored protein